MLVDGNLRKLKSLSNREDYGDDKQDERADWAIQMDGIGPSDLF